MARIPCVSEFLPDEDYDDRPWWRRVTEDRLGVKCNPPGAHRGYWWVSGTHSLRYVKVDWNVGSIGYCFGVSLYRDRPQALYRNLCFKAWVQQMRSITGVEQRLIFQAPPPPIEDAGWRDRSGDFCIGPTQHLRTWQRVWEWKDSKRRRPWKTVKLTWF